MKLGGQVWAFVLSGAHTKDGLYLLWTCRHGPVDMGLLGSPSLISYFILFSWLLFLLLVLQPVYVKDDFFDSLSCDALDRGSRNGRTKFSEQLRKDSEVFFTFPFPHVKGFYFIFLI